MCRFILLFAVLVLSHLSTLAAPLPADLQKRVAAVSGGGGAVATSPEQYAGDGDMSLKLWRRVGAKWQQKTLLASFTYQDVAFSPDGKYLATIEVDDSEPYKRVYRLRIHEVATGKLWCEAADPEAWEQLSWSRDSRHLAVATFSSEWIGDESLRNKHITGSVWMWNLTNTKQPLPKPKLAVAASERIASHTWSPDNRAIAIGLGNGRAQIWTRNDAAKANEPAFASRFALTAPEGAIEALSWSNDGRLLATGSQFEPGQATQARVWNARTGKLMKAVSLRDRSGLRRALFSPDGMRIAWQTARGVEVRRARDGRQLASLTTPRDDDWPALLGWHNSRTLRLWSRREGLKSFRVR